MVAAPEQEAVPVGGTGAGFDLVSTIAKVEERLKQDQEEVARKLEEIKKQLAGLAHKVDVDPVFSNNTSKDDSGSDGGHLVVLQQRRKKV